MGGDTDSSSDTGVELVAGCFIPNSLKYPQLSKISSQISGPISSLREWRFYQGRAFNLRHSANRACLIPGKDFFIITGGKNSAYVDRFTKNACAILLQIHPNLGTEAHIDSRHFTHFVTR